MAVKITAAISSILLLFEMESVLIDFVLQGTGEVQIYNLYNFRKLLSSEGKIQGSARGGTKAT